MYLIDKTYFRNKLEIIGLNESNNGIVDKLEDYISIYVVDFLQKLLGSVDFEDLDSNIVGGVLDLGAPQRWLDLINGKNYTKDGNTLVWKGLLYQNGSVKLSILANIVFCNIFADLETQNGRFSIDVKSAIKNVPRSHYIGIWNEIAKHFYQYYNCEEPNLSYVKNTLFIDWFGVRNENNNYVTLSEFLNDFSDDYENVNLNLGYKYINSFDI